MSNVVIYPQHFVDRLHIVWGNGFLSPGGPQEVMKIVDGLDFSGKSVLDVGCGSGGPAIVLAQETDASLIVAIDIQQALLDQAASFARKATVSSRLEFKLQKFDTNFRKAEFFMPLSPINSSTYGGFWSLDEKCL